MTREAMDICLRLLKESNKSRFDSYSVRNSILIISHILGLSRVHIFSDNLSQNSCILTIPIKVVCSGVCHVSISDHRLIFAYRKPSIGAFSKRHNTINYRNYTNFNLDHFRSDIASQNWDVLDNFPYPNDIWREWKIKF